MSDYVSQTIAEGQRKTGLRDAQAGQRWAEVLVRKYDGMTTAEVIMAQTGQRAARDPSGTDGPK